MASTTRTLTVNFVGRTSNLDKSFKRVAKGSSLMSDKLMKATRMAGIGFGALAGVTIGAAAALKPMIDKAADVEESVSKSRLVFGEASKAVEAFAETSLESFGVTRREALEATGTFGSLGKAMGMAEADSAEMATTLVGLAGDLSSLENVRVEEALTALRAGIIGEAEPLRRLGILLDAATIKQKALEIGLIKSTKEALTPAIKSQAAYALILEKGEVAMGDFARTSDSAVNTQKQLAGQWDDIQILIGEALLPAFTEMVRHLSEVVMPAFKEFFEDPSWGAFGKLAGDALTSEFSKATGGMVGDYIAAMATAGLLPAANWVLNKWIKSGNDQGDALTSGLHAVVTQFGRDNPDWYRGDWDPEASGTADGTDYGEALAAAIIAALPEDLFPGGGGMPGSGVPGADPEPPVGPSRPPPGSGHPAGPAAPGPAAPGPSNPGPFPGGGGMPSSGVSGFTKINPNTGLNAEQALRMLSDPTIDFSRFLVPPVSRSGGEGGGPSITIIAPAVSGQEVVDAIGQFVDGNGPLPPHWQQGAT